MTVVAYEVNLAQAATQVFPMDRWGYPSLTYQSSSGGVPTVEGTLERPNRGETPVWFSLGTVSAAPSELRFEGPLEAIRVTGGTAGSVGRILQSGAQ